MEETFYLFWKNSKQRKRYYAKLSIYLEDSECFQAFNQENLKYSR